MYKIPGLIYFQLNYLGIVQYRSPSRGGLGHFKDKRSLELMSQKKLQGS